MRLTQAKFAAAVGISTPAVSDLTRRGIVDLSKGLDESIRDYCAHLRATAAGRRGSGKLDLADERARLASAQADLTQIKIKTELNRLVPVDWYGEALGGVAAVLHSRMRRLPYLVRQHYPVIGISEFERWLHAIREEIADALILYLERHAACIPEAQRTELARGNALADIAEAQAADAPQ